MTHPGYSSIVMLDERPSWTNGQLTRLGNAIREGREHDAQEISYDAVLLWYGELAATVQARITDIDFSSVLGEREVRVGARPKTIDTLRDKLIAKSTLQLPSIIDLAGVRVEAAMELREQDQLAHLICEELGQDPGQVIKDIRQSPHSGYRGLHLWVKMPPGRVEIQIRTELQGAWANQYEALADVAGRGIRYGSLPSDKYLRRLCETAHEISETLKSLEDAKQVVYETSREQDSAYKYLEEVLRDAIKAAEAVGDIEEVSRCELRLAQLANQVAQTKLKSEESAIRNSKRDEEIVRSLSGFEAKFRAMRKGGSK